MAARPKRLILFASGGGTNVQNICKYFEHDNRIEIILVAGNNPAAGVWDLIKPFKIPNYCFDKSALMEGEVLQQLEKLQPDLIVLAGFLLKIPKEIVAAFPQQIINIHPALLPKYGGKGMYGLNVHKAVKENKDTQSGISIHYVNSAYDKGQLIFQTTIEISVQDTPESIAQKVHQIEYKYFPKVIEQLLFKAKNTNDK